MEQTKELAPRKKSSFISPRLVFLSQHSTRCTELRGVSPMVTTHASFGRCRFQISVQKLVIPIKFLVLLFNFSRKIVSVNRPRSLNLNSCLLTIHDFVSIWFDALELVH
jgi:hypothetical protein